MPAFLGGYEVLDELDTGGMGEVLIARKRAVGGFERLVALKTIRSELGGLGAVESMFADEARLLARLHHSGIAQVYDFGSDAGRLFLAMEYVAGVDFEQLAERRVPPAIAALAMAEALRALHAAHELKDTDGSELGVVHRDVSPGNLMLTFEGSVKVLDFGIALMRGRQAPVTEFGTLKGKPPYMSPEQVKSQRVDRRTDVFSASAVLWELLTGERLFSGDSIFAIARSIELEPPPPPSSRRPDLSPGLDEVVLRGLAKDPADRYQSALELAETLESVAAGAEPLASYALRELAADRAEHERYIAGLLGPGAPAPRAGRRTAVHTVVDAESDTDPAERAERAERAEPAEPDRGESRTWWPLALAVAVLLAGALAVSWTFFARGQQRLAVIAPPADAAVVSIDAAPVVDAAPVPVIADAAPPPPIDARPRDRRADREPVRPRPRPRADAAAPTPDPVPVPVPVEHGHLKVLADERFAQVFIDGVGHGPTPTGYIKLTAGPHLVVWKEPDTGAVRKRQTVIVEADRRVKARARR